MDIICAERVELLNTNQLTLLGYEYGRLGRSGHRALPGRPPCQGPNLPFAPTEHLVIEATARGSCTGSGRHPR